jgi:hypothetical protein
MDNASYEPEGEPEIPEAEKMPLTPRAKRAAGELGLKPEHVLSFRESPDHIGFVTHGGRKLLWPKDARKIGERPPRARELTQEDKDGIARRPLKKRA